MHIGIDLDHVVYPFTDVFAQYVHTVTGRPLTELGPAQRWEFYEDWGYSLDEFFRFFVEGVDAGFIFRKGLPVPGALDALHALKRAGHTLHIVTNRSVGRHSQASSEAWLKEHGVPCDSITYAADKNVVGTDVFIDDMPENVLALREAGCAAFLFATGRDDQSGFRPDWSVRSWGEFVGQVEALEPQRGVSGRPAGVVSVSPAPYHLAKCRWPGCNWEQLHTDKESAHQDAREHVLGWHGHGK
jgi:FMN phosphatase YigB (HAD superfamily)